MEVIAGKNLLIVISHCQCGDDVDGEEAVVSPPSFSSLHHIHMLGCQAPSQEQKSPKMLFLTLIFCLSSHMLFLILSLYIIHFCTILFILMVDGKQTC